MSTIKKKKRGPTPPKIKRSNKELALDLLLATEPILEDYIKLAGQHKPYAIQVLKEARALLAEDKVAEVAVAPKKYVSW